MTPAPKNVRVRDGLLEAFERREARARRRATVTAAIATASLLAVLGYLFAEVRDLQDDRDRLRDLCGLKPASEILGR